MTLRMVLETILNAIHNCVQYTAKGRGHHGANAQQNVDPASRLENILYLVTMLTLVNNADQCKASLKLEASQPVPGRNSIQL